MADDSVTRVGGFHGPQVCGLVGISYRQLDYWARTGLLQPSVSAAKGSGSRRVYSYADVLELKVIKQGRILNLLLMGDCFGANAADARSRLCYNDIQPLYYDRGIDHHVFPYIHATLTGGVGTRGFNEYPVLTGVFM